MPVSCALYVYDYLQLLKKSLVASIWCVWFYLVHCLLNWLAAINRLNKDYLLSASVFRCICCELFVYAAALILRDCNWRWQPHATYHVKVWYLQNFEKHTSKYFYLFSSWYGLIIVRPKNELSTSRLIISEPTSYQNRLNKQWILKPHATACLSV